MLQEFLRANHEEIIARARRRVAERTAPLASDVELHHGIPVFLGQLGDALSVAQSSSKEGDHAAIAASAAQHGEDLRKLGLTLGQVVHDYGDVCQVVTELAVEQDASITADEFRTFNLCLDDAIAGAVTEYARQVGDATAAAETERFGVFSHELRNLLGLALLSFDTIKKGLVGPRGSTGEIHGRSLMRLRDLVDRSLTEVRLDAGTARLERVALGAFIKEIEMIASIEARSKRVSFAVGPAPPVFIEADRQILASAVANLLQNAFKFSRPGGKVRLTTRATEDRVLIDVEDECGGLPPGKAEDLFRPFEQRSTDRTGLGLGLLICAKAARAHGGVARVRDLPGKGCVFTLDLPRSPERRS
jgi:signal transduction histidine kinase